MTGSTPSRHGMIANDYLDPKVNPRELFRGCSVPRNANPKTMARRTKSCGLTQTLRRKGEQEAHDLGVRNRTQP
ncbi:hypothetical protein [Candidatus Spongiihabitans sp.]|uniref:hypothetical protein n=1 Tax=Candidatus Spongiihabitans sp. TaxID=3101308 RepID=UPI003C7CB014